MADIVGKAIDANDQKHRSSIVLTGGGGGDVKKYNGVVVESGHPYSYTEANSKYGNKFNFS